MRLRVLGSADVDGSSLPLRERQVVGVLFVRRESSARASDFAEAMWRSEPPPSARKVVQGCIMRLRRALGPNSILTMDGSYRLSHDVTVDADAFEDSYTRALEERRNGHAQRAAVRLAECLSSWRGVPLVDLDGWAPADAEGRRLISLRESAIDERIAALREAGYPADAATVAATAAREAPFREVRWAEWARSLYAAGQPAEALATLALLRERLADELGVDPSPEIQRLEIDILRQSVSLDVLPAIQRDAPSPWPGLVPYEAADAEYYFGRQREVAAAVANLTRPPGRLALVGASGCGKSSLLRAGVVARFASENRACAVITPGAHPAERLQSVGPCELLIVDQGEEVLTQCDSYEEGAAFFDELASFDSAVAVAVRADMLDRLCAFRGFAHILQSGLLVVTPLDAAGVRAVIEGPASAAGVRLEHGLTEVIITESAGDPAALPLISHALAETWKRAEGNALTVAAYRAAGGLTEAVAASAESVYSALDEGSRARMRNLCLRLVADDGDGTRGRAGTDAATPALVEKLVAARLLSVTGDGYLQLAHETLIARWPRLAEWLDEDREGRRLLQSLARDAQRWRDDGEPGALLYSGVRLDAASEWSRAHPSELTPAEQRFVERARDRVGGELRRSRRNNRRLAIAVATAACLIAATVVGAVAAVKGRTEADAARAVSERALAHSEALRIMGLADSARDPAVALGLVAEALALRDAPDVRELALEVFGRFADLLPPVETPASWPPADAAVTKVSVASTDDGAVRAITDGHRILIYGGSGRLLRVLEGLPTTPEALAFDRQGERLAVALSEVEFADTGTTIVWDVGAGVEIQRFVSGDGPVWSHLFSEDGTTLFSYGASGLHAWDLTSSRALVRTQGGTPTMFRTTDLTLSIDDLTVDSWQRLACGLAGRSLTSSEWERLVPEYDHSPIC